MTRQIVLVCGPPCAGKSTLVDQRAQPTDLVVCHDRLAQAAGSPRAHVHHKPYRDRAELELGRQLREIVAGHHDRAWIIGSLPLEAERLELARLVNATHTIVLTEDRDVLLERARQRPHAVYTTGVIDWWLQAYAADQRRLQSAATGPERQKIQPSAPQALTPVSPSLPEVGRNSQDRAEQLGAAAAPGVPTAP